MLTGAFHKLSVPVAPLDTACMQSLKLHMPGLIDSAAKREAPIRPSNSFAAYDRPLGSTTDPTEHLDQGKKRCIIEQTHSPPESAPSELR